MYFYRPIETAAALPTVGDAIERVVLDFKAQDSGKAFERAKDVAAFANRLGGTLVVGGVEIDSVLKVYKGCSAADAGAIRKAFSQSVGQRCQPLPEFDSDDLPNPTDPTKRIVVVNVRPSLQLIGVKIKGDTNDGFGDPCFVYPVRSGIDAIYLEPSQLAMYMTPSVRRVAVMISKIPPQTMITVHRLHPTGSTLQATPSIFEEIRETENLVILRNTGGAEQRLPLDCVTTVYENFDAAANRTVWEMWVQFHR